MVALTKAQGKAALEHVMKNVLQLDDDSAVLKSFTKDGLNDI